MSRFLAGIAALTLAGAATLPIQASAAEQAGISASKAVTSTDMSAQRRYWRYRHGYYGPRRHWGPGYGYYGGPYAYGYPAPYAYGYPHYYRPAPFVGFGFGPFGFRVF
jgi:hypothetical protein